MQKYLSIFKISFQQEFIYKLSFLMWRLRNMMQVTVFYFLWTAAFANRNTTLFGYNLDSILTYSLLLIFIRAITLSSRSVDVAGQIANGDLTNLLTKPVGFFGYWFTRDASSKFLNLVFSLVEFSILFLLLKPPLVLQTDPLYMAMFVVSLIIAVFIFFNILMLTNFVPFWYPEVAWGAQFLVVVIIVEFLSGALFPIDVFPAWFSNFLLLTPFPYLIFIPIKIFLGSLPLTVIYQYLFVGVVWCVILWKLTQIVWKKGLLSYEAVGR